MEDKLKEVEHAIKKMTAMIAEKGGADPTDTEALDSLRSIKQDLQRQTGKLYPYILKDPGGNPAKDKHIILNTEIVNGTRVVVSGGGFGLKTSDFMKVKGFIDGRLEYIVAKEKESETLNKYRGDAAKKRKENAAGLRKNSIDAITQKIGGRKKLTYREFDEIWQECESRDAHISKANARAHFREIIDLTRK